MEGCFTGYVEVNDQVVEWFTERNCYLAEKVAKKYVQEHNLQNAKIVVEDTTDKYM